MNDARELTCPWCNSTRILWSERFSWRTSAQCADCKRTFVDGQKDWPKEEDRRKTKTSFWDKLH